MSIYSNRILDLKKITTIGFDMDHTLVHYHIENFERLTYQSILPRLVKKYHYPSAILELVFEPQLAIRGLVLDKKNGNLLKLSRFGQIKTASHGTKFLSYKECRNYYLGRYVDLGDPDFYCVDTAFSISHCVLFAQLVTLKDDSIHTSFPSYEQMANDVLTIIDELHRDGTLKDCVKENLPQYILQTPAIPQALEKLKLYNKKLLLITNSPYSYTKLLMEYAFDPFLQSHEKWQDLFVSTITLAHKPRFFMEQYSAKKLEENIFEEGCAHDLQEWLQAKDHEILYIGDHIYGDIVTLKKHCRWRTALVVEEIKQEVEQLKAAQPLANRISQLMKLKQDKEFQLYHWYEEKNEFKREPSLQKKNALINSIKEIDTQLGDYIEQYNKYFNPYWGEVMRAGFEESRFANQVEKYACIYMSSVADLLSYSPRNYFRPHRRLLPHDA